MQVLISVKSQLQIFLRVLMLMKSKRMVTIVLTKKQVRRLLSIQMMEMKWHSQSKWVCFNKDVAKH
jgi:hypothetical protein